MTDSLIVQFQKIDELLKGAQKVLIASHENPDPDAVASVLTFDYVFRKKNLETLPFLPNLPPKNLSFLPGFFEVKNEIGSFKPDSGNLSLLKSP